MLRCASEAFPVVEAAQVFSAALDAYRDAAMRYGREPVAVIFDNARADDRRVPDRHSPRSL